jgi:hypothetical protein
MTTSRSATLVRRWVALYTAGLPADIRDARREEIAADLWSQAQEAERLGAAGTPASDVLGRLVFGLWADITWRLEQGLGLRGQPVNRSLSRGTRIIAALAIIGGAALAAGLALTLALVAAAPDGTFGSIDYNATAFIASRLVYDGAVVIVSIALWGLTFRFQDRIPGGVALLGCLGGFGGMLSAMGAYPLLLLLPIGSAVVAWDLARFGAMPRTVAIVHAMAAVAFFVVVVAAVMYWESLANWPIGAMGVLLLPYPLTWVVIGAVLLRGQPLADHPVSSVEVPR